jgi:hypothetical protein
MTPHPPQNPFHVLHDDLVKLRLDAARQSMAAEPPLEAAQRALWWLTIHLPILSELPAAVKRRRRRFRTGYRRMSREARRLGKIMRVEALRHPLFDDLNRQIAQASSAIRAEKSRRLRHTIEKWMDNWLVIVLTAVVVLGTFMFLFLQLARR